MADLDGTSVCINGRCRWEATITVTVVDADGEPVENATLTFDWDDGRRSGTKTCASDSNGQCSVSRKNGKRRSSITFTVKGVTHETLSYNVAVNADPDGDSDGVTITVNKPYLHVADLDGTSVCINGRCRWEATITVTVVDADGEPVENATLTFDWDDGRRSGTKTCASDSNGQCSVSRKNGKRRSSITFTVKGVTHETLSYNVAVNADPDGDSDGVTITVNKP